MHIKKHDYVFIDDGLRYKIYKIVDMIIHIKRCKLNLLFLVNKKYGSTFIYKSKEWVRCKKRKSKLEIDVDTEVEGTNSNIFCDINAQSLSEKNIVALKKNEDNPFEVVQKIIDSSSTFKEKTKISKFKYVEKKLKRHLIVFTVYECNIVNLIRYFYKFSPGKVCNIRIDYLANILFHLNKNFLRTEKTWKKEIENTTSKNVKGIEKDTQNEECEHKEMEENPEDDEWCSKQNIIVYDDSCGMLSAVLNIFFNDSVTIYSLVHKNCSSFLMPLFGIKKNQNVFHINILNFDETTYKENTIYLNKDLDFVVPFKSNNENCNNYLNGDHMKKEQLNKSMDAGNILNKDNCEHIEYKRKIPVTTEKPDEIKKRRTDEKKVDIDKTEEENYENEQDYEEEQGQEQKQEKKETKELDVEGKNRNSNQCYERQQIKLNEVCKKKAESFVILLSNSFLYESNTNANLLLETLVKIALKFLKNDSKFILYADDFVLSNVIMNLLHSTNSFINIKLNEYILREQQVMKRRTHPIISSAKLADGFLITATKVAC